jgi:hypothetical protein
LPGVASTGARTLDSARASIGLSALLDELEEEADTLIVRGSEKATNTAENRRRRFDAYYSALLG